MKTVPSEVLMKDMARLGQAFAEIQTIVVERFEGNDRELILSTLQRAKDDIRSGMKKGSSEFIGESTASVVARIV